MTSTETIIVTLISTLNIFLFVAITLEAGIQKNLTKSWRFSRGMSVVGLRLSLGFTVILLMTEAVVLKGAVIQII